VGLPGGAGPAARATISYGAQLTATGGGGGYRWTIASGTMPLGVQIDAVTGTIGGMPVSAGTSTFTVHVSDYDDAANAAETTYSIAVGASPVQIGAAGPISGRVTIAQSSTLTASGGTGAYAWAISSGALPQGLALNGATGAISGTPAVAGSFTVTVSLTDTADAANVATASVSLTIAPGVKVASPRTLPDAALGTPYAYTVLAANAIGTVKWNLQGGALPGGLTLNATTGVISGTPAARGTYTFNARVKDSNTDDTRTLTLVVK
jgi:hypothetical protein